MDFRLCQWNHLDKVYLITLYHQNELQIFLHSLSSFFNRSISFSWSSVRPIKSFSFFSLLKLFSLLYLFCLLFLMSWWNPPRLSKVSYNKLLLDNSWVFSNTFSIEGRTENLFPLLMSFLSLDSTIFEFTNCLNFSWIRELTMENLVTNLLTNVAYPVPWWILITPIFRHVTIDVSMFLCKCKYSWNL